jgi:hypothetical protein
MLIEPASLANNLPRLEEIEKASMRLVTQAVYNFRVDAAEIYQNETDKAQDIGEDITREALDRLGVSKIDQRLFGKMDYKRARYVFHPEYAIRQALFVDSKAEDVAALNSARIQIAQTSLRVRQVRGGVALDVQGMLPPVLPAGGEFLLTTTVFVKYNYQVLPAGDARLMGITVAALPNGMLQDAYNPHARDTIFIVGPDAPSLGEKFRTRLSFPRLAAKAAWRVQRIPLAPALFVWAE